MTINGFEHLSSLFSHASQKLDKSNNKTLENDFDLTCRLSQFLRVDITEQTKFKIEEKTN